MWAGPTRGGSAWKKIPIPGHIHLKILYFLLKGLLIVCNQGLGAPKFTTEVYLLTCSNPTCFFRCKSRDHLSFYRRSDQKGDRIVIGYYRIVIKYYSVAPQRRACGRDPPIEERRACGRDPPKKNKKMDHYMLCLSYPQALKPQINSLQLSNNIL